MLIGAIEIGAIFLIFPTETTTLPDVGKAAATICFRDTLLKAVRVGVVSFIRRWFAEHAAEIDEMLLCRLPLGAVGAAPFVDELFWRHAATTLIRAADRDLGFLRMTISMSRSSALSNVISRSTENPSSL